MRVLHAHLPWNMHIHVSLPVSHIIKNLHQQLMQHFIGFLGFQCFHSKSWHENELHMAHCKLIDQWNEVTTLGTLNCPTSQTHTLSSPEWVWLAKLMRLLRIMRLGNMLIISLAIQTYTLSSPEWVRLASLINPLRECVTRLPCLSVCLSVKSHLTSGASVRRENVATYSETAPLQRSSAPSLGRPYI